MFYLLVSIFYVSLLHIYGSDAKLAGAHSKEVFVFSTDKTNWKSYAWEKITTIVEFGYHDPELVKFAHERNVKVAGLANFDKKILKDGAQIIDWVKSTLESVQRNKWDGVNVDFEDEISCSDVASRDGYNQLVYLLGRLLKKQDPHSQLSIDFAWSPLSIDNRCYDYVTLSSMVDVVFVMSYDERSQIFGECKAWANSAYQETLKGVREYIGIGVEASKMVLGVPWYGYDYPCISYVVETSTCELKRVSFRNVTCSDAAGAQIGYTDIIHLITSSSLPSSSPPPPSSSLPSSSSSSSSPQSPLKFIRDGRKIEIVMSSWDADALSPFFTYKVVASGEYHQVWYDNAMSLRIKYLLSEALGLKGVGFWEADSLRYDGSEASKMSVSEMWGALP